MAWVMKPPGIALIRILQGIPKQVRSGGAPRRPHPPGEQPGARGQFCEPAHRPQGHRAAAARAGESYEWKQLAGGRRQRPLPASRGTALRA